MVRFFPVFFYANSRKVYVARLAFAWILGLVCGSMTALSADRSFLPLMRLAPLGQMSIVGLLVSILLPFLFSAVGLSLFGHWFLTLFVFVRAFLLSCVMSGVFITYGSAGWIVDLLFLFSDFLFTPVLLWFWIHSAGCKQYVMRCGTVVLFLLLVIGYLDFRFVSPFLAGLLTM